MKKSLTPPPVAPAGLKPMRLVVSFQTYSSNDEPLTFPTVVPTESTNGSLAGYCTCAFVSPTLESVPVSPEAMQTVTPCKAAS